MRAAPRLLLFLFLCVQFAAASENWPRFRGPVGSGEAPASVKLPTDWFAKGAKWKAKLAGTGHSSPVIWGGKIFVTSATDRGAKRIVQCFDLQKGNELWQKEISSATHKRHKFNSYATTVRYGFGKLNLQFTEGIGERMAVNGLWERIERMETDLAEWMRVSVGGVTIR